MIDEKLIAVGIVILYYIIGGVLNGLMHRFGMDYCVVLRQMYLLV